MSKIHAISYRILKLSLFLPFLLCLVFQWLFLLPISSKNPFADQISSTVRIKVPLITNSPIKHTFELKLKYDLSLSFSELTHLSPEQYKYGNNPYKGIHVYPYRRYGNDFYQVLRALQYCDLFGWEYLYASGNILGLNHNFKVKNISVVTNPSDIPSDIRSHLLHGHFFYQLERYKIDLDLRYADYLKDHVAIGLEDTNLTEKDLILHIRSGDVFSNTGWPSNYYAQPPLQFYLDIINRENWSSVRILAEDFNNPLIGELMNMGYEWKQHSFHHDLSILLQTENLAIGQGTIGIAVALLSKKLKNLYTFNQESGKMMSHWNCQPDKDYERVFMNQPHPDIPLTHKEEMLHALKTTKCNWSRIHEYSNTHFVWRDGDG